MLEPVDLSSFVKRARDAQPAWHASGTRVRVRLLEKFRQLLYRDRAAIAALVTEETGKPLPESYIADVATALEGARFLVRVAEETLAPVRYRSGVLAAWRKSITTHHDPFGIVAVVSPWNYPFFLPAMHSMSALVAGNAVLLKPSEHTPRCGDALARLLHEAGVPSGAFQVIQGDCRTGAALVASDVDKVFFTGSERTGRAIADSCAPRFVPVCLELGGSDAALVLDDARLDVAASGITWGRFTNAGQTCAAVKRVIVHDGVHDALVDGIIAAVKALDLRTDVSVLITAGQRELLELQVRDAVARGATVALRREGVSAAGQENRAAPLVVLTDVTPDMRVWYEETFGPVLAVVRSTSDTDAIALANATRYGLSASVWSSDRGRARRVAAGIKAGAV
ncbi:MAG TPA: aldehyde dehydrogenase family protein, partial [Gemmatimonas sp.]|nr:aldehyde dehydrogenase family protein [Gemmatimonas sp.]